MAAKAYRISVAAFTLISLIHLVKPHIEDSWSDVSSQDDSATAPRGGRRFGGLSIDFTNHKEVANNELVKPYNILSPSIRRSHATGQQGQLPIDFASIGNLNMNQKSLSNIKSTTPGLEDSTRKAEYPPLNRRFRRIYNPDEVASIDEFPFVAALLVNGELWCGAVIIDKDRVLTAAHCLQLQYNNRFFREYAKMLTVRVGSSNATAGGELLRVAEIFFHPNYKPQTLEFNFAVVKLHRNLTFGFRDGHINSIPYSTNLVVPVDNQITFLGWGSVLGITGAGGQVLLQKVRLPVYDISDCQEVYGRELVTRTNFCAGYITLPKNVCNHDAGGPAIMDGVLVGILSFSSKRCDQPDQPAVFSIVGTVESWLTNLGNKRVQLLKTAIKSPEMIGKE